MMSYLSQRIDEIAVVTSWDSTEVLYLDRRGEERILNLDSLLQMLITNQPETEPVPQLWLTMLPRTSNSETGASPFSHEVRSQYLLTINIQLQGVASNVIQIQQSVATVPLNVGFPVRNGSSVTPGLAKQLRQ